MATVGRGTTFPLMGSEGLELGSLLLRLFHFPLSRAVPGTPAINNPKNYEITEYYKPEYGYGITNVDPQ
jgi:hypothetical protein